MWQPKPPLGSQINWSHPLARGLVGCWLFNEGAGVPSNLVNKQGVGFTGTPVWSPGAVSCSSGSLNLGAVTKQYDDVTVVVAIADIPTGGGTYYPLFTIGEPGGTWGLRAECWAGLSLRLRVVAYPTYNTVDAGTFSG